jgi:pyruvate dehydrogenase E1 component alpha subunit
VLSDEDEQRIRNEIAEEIGAAVKQMESEAEVTAEQLFDHVYATLPPRLERQRRALGESDEGARG